MYISLRIEIETSQLQCCQCIISRKTDVFPYVLAGFH